MPLSKPRAGESKEDFIGRFHSEAASEFPDESQRSAVAYRQWASKDAAGPGTPLRQLMDGTLEEMEHTDDRREAVRIALDHLTEDRDYYNKLKEAGLMDTKDMSEMEVFKAGLSRVARCLRGVAKAALPEGTVTHRADGDWKKVGGEWKKLPAKQAPSKAPTRGGSEKLSSSTKKMLDAEARPRMEELRQQYHEFKREAGPDDRTTLQDFARLIVGEEEGLFHTKQGAKPAAGEKSAPKGNPKAKVDENADPEVTSKANTDSVSRAIDEGWGEDDVRDALYSAAHDAGISEDQLDWDEGTDSIAAGLGLLGVDASGYFHAGNRSK